MSIIRKEVENASKLVSIRGWETVCLQIDPNSVHQTALPGDHTQFSCILGKGFEKYVEKIQNFKVRPCDIWIVGLPKTGTTWMHNIVYKLKYGLNCESIAEKLEDRFFDKQMSLTGTYDDRLNEFNEASSPRIFKTHLPAFLLPKELWTVKPRIIYTARNPKDSALSGYHMVRNSKFPFNGTIDQYSEQFLDDSGWCMPYFDHVRGFLQLRDLDHVLFTTYEDLVANPYQGIQRICDFLKCPHTDDELLGVMGDVSFKKMRSEFRSFFTPEDESAMLDPDYK